MAGTEKQIKWAADIKAEALRLLRGYLAEKGVNEADFPGVTWLAAQDDAPWWIDNRVTDGRDVGMAAPTDEHKLVHWVNVIQDAHKAGKWSN